MAARELYVERVEVQLKKLATLVFDLRNRAERGSKEAKLELERISRELRPRERALRQQMGKAKGSTNEAWRDLRTGLEGAWRDLKSAYDRATEAYGTAAAKPRRNRTASTRRPRTITVKKR